MAEFKETAILCFVVFQLLVISCQGSSKDAIVKSDNERKALLEAMMFTSEFRSPSLKRVRVRRGARRHHRPNWKDHPLYPLYPIDFEACEDSARETKKGLCTAWEKAGYCKKARWMMKLYCKKTCGMCKSPSPPYCESSKFGCCWDNKPAEGPNGEGCPPCFDVYKITCPQFTDYCNRHGRNGRFIRYHCFQSCGRCALQGSYHAQH